MDFDFKPSLKGSLLSLRPLTKNDFEGLFAAASDPMIWAQHPATDRYKKPVFSGYFAEALASNTALIASDNATNQIIGTSRYHGFDRDKNEIEIGWSFLARAYWGGRYNAQMKRLMLEHAFQFVDSVVLIIGADNARSQRAAAKIGAVLTNEHLLRNDAANVVYTLYKANFAREAAR